MMQETRQESCATCRYFFALEILRAMYRVDGEPGYCRRRAPVAGSYFPVVGSNEWCGEFQLIPAAKQPEIND